MSTRTYMISLKSIEPIKNAVGLQDRALLEALVEAVGDDEEFQSYAKDMIMTSPPRAREPGCWNYLAEPLAAHLGLSPRRLPLEDWKHYFVWDDYRSVADALVSEQGKALLAFLEEGRPFVGSSVEHDGCMYAWLTVTEVQSLLGELTAIDAEEFGDLDEFHEELIESLQKAVDDNSALFLGAH